MSGAVAAAGFAFGVVPAVWLAVAATLVLAWAWHGRQVDAHPMCRRCGFGLNGRDPFMAPACPDCGADLRRARAVRVGRRRKRPALLALSACLILGSTLWITVASWTQAKGVQFIHHAPSSWLLEDLGDRDPRARDAALAELTRRILQGRLSRGDEQALLEQALARQADWTLPWATGWGDVVEAARAAGRLSNEQWARYQVQSVSLALEPEKDTVRRTDDLVLNLFRGPDRVSSRRTSFDLLLQTEPGVSIAGRPVNVPHETLDSTLAVPGDPARDAKSSARTLARSGPIRLIRDASLKGLAGGQQAVKVGVVIRPVRLEDVGIGNVEAYTPMPGERRVEVAGKFVLRDEDAPLDQLVGPEWKGVWVPPEKREALLRAAAKRKVTVRPTTGR